MRTFSFGVEQGRHIDRHGSNFLISRLVHSAQIHVACMRLGPGGLIGYHQAMDRQLFAVVEGEGWVRAGTEERVPIRAGEAAVWERGEFHEAGSDTGMVAIVVEGDVLTARPEEIGPVQSTGTQWAPQVNNEQR